MHVRANVVTKELVMVGLVSILSTCSELLLLTVYKRQEGLLRSTHEMCNRIVTSKFKATYCESSCDASQE